MAATKVHGKITMAFENWKKGQIEQLSPVVRIGGYPWRLRIYKNEDARSYHDDFSHHLAVICDKSTESELWGCKAWIWADGSYEGEHTFLSWNNKEFLTGGVDAYGDYSDEVTVTIATTNDGEIWRRRPMVDFFAPRNGVIVIGVNKRNIHVNKKSLASESPFFHRRFHENNMNKVHIEDVEYEEFSNLLNLFYGLDGACLTDKNVLRVLHLADHFEFKIVKDRIVSFFLSSACSLSAYTKYVYSSIYTLPFTEEYFVGAYDPNASKDVDLVRMKELLEHSRPVIAKSSTSSIENKGRPLRPGGNGKKVDDPATPHFWDEGYNTPPFEGHISVSGTTFVDGINLSKKSRHTDKICRSLVKKCNLN